MLRAQARVDTGAIERNCARLAALGAAVRGGEGERLRPWRGRGRAGGAARRRGVAGGGDRGRGGGAARRRARRTAAGHGRAARRRSCRVALEADADVVAWRRGLRRAAARARRACTSSSTPGWAGSARAIPRRPRAVAAAAGRRGWPGAMTHFATADDDPAFMAEQLERFLPWADSLGVMRHAANSAGGAARARRAAGHDPLRDRDLRHGPVPPRPGRPRARARARAGQLRRRGQARAGGGEHRLRPPVHRRARHLDRDDPDRLRRRGPPRAHRAGPRSSSAAAASRSPARSRWTTSPSTSATSRSSAAPRRSCSAPAAPSGSWPRTGRPRSARSTTR